MKIHELQAKLKALHGKEIAKSDVLLLLKDLGITVQDDSVPDAVAQSILDKVSQAKAELPQAKQAEPAKKQEQTTGTGLEQTIASAGFQSTQAILNLFQSVDADAESLAHLATAKFVAKFSQTMAQNQTDFSTLYMRGLAHRLDEIQNQVTAQINQAENFIQALPQSKPGEAIKSLLPSLK